VGEASKATGVGGDPADTSMPNAGAVFVYTRSGTTWSQEAYLKPSNTRAGEDFGSGLAISSDGSTLVAGALGDGSKAIGVNDLADQNDDSMNASGAAFVFTRSGTTWTQQAYLKPSNTRKITGEGIGFGWEASISTNGNSLLIGAMYEPSDATGVNGDQTNTTNPGAGAVYAFSRSGTTWTQAAYVKPSNTRANMSFGSTVRISGDGTTVAVGASNEGCSVSGINGNQNNGLATGAGAVYVF
jgi:hypothetical protein